MRQLQPFHVGLDYIHLFLRLQPQLHQPADGLQAATESDNTLSQHGGPTNQYPQPRVSTVLDIGDMEEPFGLVVQELARNIGDSVQQLNKEHSYSAA
jgi:hypothetical protein